MKKTFSPEVRETIYKAQNGYCFCCKDCLEKITEFHHIKANTEVNKKNYPLFLQSPFNCLGIFQACHQSPRIFNRKITDKEAQVYEDYLRRLINER